MNDLQKILDWIKDPNRNYSAGLSLYLRFRANPKHDAYFKTNEAEPCDAAINLLYQKIVGISVKIKSNPTFLESVVVKSALKPIAHNAPTPKAKQPIVTKTIGMQTPKEVIKKETIATPPMVPDSKLDNLPLPLREAGERIKEITPLMGGLQAKLKALKPEQVDQAKALTKQLIALGSEKSKLWEQIDTYTGEPDRSIEGKEEEKEEEKPPTKDELRYKIKICRDGIKRIKNKLPEQRKNKPELAEKNEESLKERNLQLKDLEKQLKALG